VVAVRLGEGRGTRDEGVGSIKHQASSIKHQASSINHQHHQHQHQLYHHHHQHVHALVQAQRLLLSLACSAKLTRPHQEGPLTIAYLIAVQPKTTRPRRPAPTFVQSSPPMPLPTKLSTSAHHPSTNTTPHPDTAQRRLDTLSHHFTPTTNTIKMSSEPV
jgi:hypothetical protein